MYCKKLQPDRIKSTPSSTKSHNIVHKTAIQLINQLSSQYKTTEREDKSTSYRYKYRVWYQN